MGNTNPTQKLGGGGVKSGVHQGQSVPATLVVSVMLLTPRPHKHNVICQSYWIPVPVNKYK